MRCPETLTELKVRVEIYSERNEILVGVVWNIHESAPKTRRKVFAKRVSRNTNIINSLPFGEGNQ